MKNTFRIFLIVLALPLLHSCGNGNASSSSEGETVEMRYAKNLSISELEDGVSVARFRNPWDTTRTLQTIVMVPRDMEMPSGLPDGIVVRVPLQKSVVYTAVHNSLIEELGAADAVAGVCDAKYIQDGVISHRVDSGTIADCGSNMAPNIERILSLKPDAILLSAFENSNDHNKVGQLGIPVIDCPDYMELSPLGRAEWMRFFGLLYGRREKADSLFDVTEKSYLDLKRKVADSLGGAKERPKVLTELIYGQSWDVPGAKSTVGVMIGDAGGVTPFPEYRQSGSVKLSPEEVLFKAKDADIWLVKYAQAVPMTLAQLGGENPLYTKFKAYGTGNVYGLDTTRTTYFEDAAFHPDWILEELVRIFHPGLLTDEKKHTYYQKLKP